MVNTEFGYRSKPRNIFGVFMPVTFNFSIANDTDGFRFNRIKRDYVFDKVRLKKDDIRFW